MAVPTLAPIAPEEETVSPDGNRPGKDLNNEESGALRAPDEERSTESGKTQAGKFDQGEAWAEKSECYRRK